MVGDNGVFLVALSDGPRLCCRQEVNDHVFSGLNLVCSAGHAAARQGKEKKNKKIKNKKRNHRRSRHQPRPRKLTLLDHHSSLRCHIWRGGRGGRGDKERCPKESC
ncbi:hypothetical protein VTO42DRAFT_837 [Malbranchea cinnamomea]